MSDTPRTDAAYAASTGAGIYELFKESQDIERELNAANVEIEEKLKDVVWLATEKAKLENYVMLLEEAGDRMRLFCADPDDCFAWDRAKETKL